MQIRRATSTDITAIQALYSELDRHHADIMPRYFQRVAGNIRTDAAIAGWIASADKACFVAEVEGRVVGFACVAEREHPALPMFRRHRYGLIDDAAVAAGHRGRGIGQALFAATVEWLRGRGIAAAQVQVWNDNAGAYRFYERQGFKPITTRMELDI